MKAFALAALIGFAAAAKGDRDPVDDGMDLPVDMFETPSTDEVVVEESNEIIVDDVAEVVKDAVFVNNLGLDNRVESADLTNVWSSEEINNFVIAEFGGKEWTAIQDNNLVSEATRQMYATSIVTKFVSDWSGSVGGLPAVCEAGEACRASHFKDAMAEITEDWSSTLDQINLLINGAVKNVKKTLTIGYEDAYACMPGCTCDNIMIEYNSVL